MTALPAGTVTFFFSDIEGSTRLLEALGRDYDGLLERHHRIAREAFARCAAVELGTEGDSFFAVFPAATDAVAAAVTIQRAITAEPWPNGATVRVRIGLHTGEARIAGGDYVGLDVHRAARIMSAAHGGQILISEATRVLVDRGLADGVELRDVGQHRLRDLSSRERLFQVIAPGLQADFPALRTLDATPNNLPTQTSDIVGREAELEAIRRHLHARAVRLVTLTGPGGIGKTRLALQAGADHVEAFPDGVYFVDLSASRDAGAALQSIMRTVGVTPAGDEQPREAIARHLGNSRVLLVLDNFEQVMSAAGDVASLLAQCSMLKLLVTSREALRVRGEQLFPVSPLSLPEASRARVTADDVSRFDAVRLFVNRAQEARPTFELTDENAAVIADICARLDGLPLALELAAARLKLFSVDELRDRLRSRLELLRGGARDLPARQRTLRGTIEWSYELLDDEERRIFQLLSVFPSARLDAVEQLAARLEPLAAIDVLDRLASLVDRSLVRSSEDASGRRLSMLDTIREYGAEQLAADPAFEVEARRAHAEYFAAFAQARHGRHGREREAAFDELASELGNLQTAWRFFVETADIGQLNKLVDPLWLLHDSRGWYHGAVALANELLAVLSTAPPAPDRAEEEITLRMSLARALLALRGYTGEVERLYRDALSLADAQGAVPRRLPVLRSLASFYLYRAEIDKSAAIGREILELGEHQGDTAMQIEGHVIVGPAVAFLGDVPLGLDHLARAIALFDPERHGPAPLRLGPSPGVVAPAISGLFHWLIGQPDTAARRAASALDVAARLHHPYSLAYATFHVALLDLWTGRLAVADERAAAVLRIAEEHDYNVWRAIGLILQGVTTAGLGEPERGLARTEQGIALYENLQTPPVFWPAVLTLKAQVCAMAGRTGDGLAAVDEAARLTAEGSWDSASLNIQRADLLVSAGDVQGAEASLRRARAEAQQAGSPMLELQALTRLARIERPSGGTESADALRQIVGTFTEGFDTADLVAARGVLDQAAGIAP